MDAASLRLDVHRNMSPLGISQWTSPANAVEKVEEMLSKAINYQKDLWDILVVQSTESDPTREMRQGDLIPPQLLKSLKSKLENSMDSCNSALNRLKDIMVQTTSLPSLASPENLELQKEWNTYVGSFFLNELSQLSSGPQTKLRVSFRLEHAVRSSGIGSATISWSCTDGSRSAEPINLPFAYTRGLM